MKWEIELRYEEGCGPTKLSGIGFRKAIYGGYDTKEEALEAFCCGQVALNKLRKENEKKEEETKLEGFLNKVEERMKDLREGQEPQVQEEEVKQQYGDGFLPPEGYTNGKEKEIRERLDYIEQRIDVADDYLATIGSPEWGLRKQVKRLEERIDSINHYLTDGYLPPNYKGLEERIKALEIGKSKKEETTAIGKYGPNWYCESCYGFVEKEDKFCSHCGRRIIEEKEE